MISFRETLKEVENSIKAGFKNNAWFPHKSVEGGARTLGYGHKLSQAEEDGNYVVMPDGRVIDFDDRGLTDQEIETLLDADIAKARSIAAKQWNSSQKTSFSELNPLHQSLLSEIVFNIGTLKNKDTKKFGWPSLAKGILTDDPEQIKNELMRSFTDKNGNKKQLTSRVNKIRAVVDEYYTSPQEVKFENFSQGAAPEEPEMSYSSIIDGLMQSLDTLQGRPPLKRQAASQQPEDDGSVESIMKALDEGLTPMQMERRRNERKLEQTYNEVLAEKESGKKFSDSDEKDIQEIMRALDGEVVVVDNNTNPPKEPKPKQPIEGKEDGSRDPIFGIF